MTGSNIKRLPSAYAPARRSVWFRWLQLLLGFFLFGIVIALLVKSGLGLGPWDAFHEGLHRLTGISIGLASVLVGGVVLAVSVAFGVRPGLGTLANMVVIGVFTDLLLPLVPAAHGVLHGLAYYAAGLGIGGFASGLYISAGLGKGPRDGLMIALSQRTGWPVRRVRTLMEVAVLAFGYLMGGTIGAGTLLFTAAIGPVTQWGLQRFGMSATGDVRPLPAPAADRRLRDAA